MSAFLADIIIEKIGIDPTGRKNNRAFLHMTMRQIVIALAGYEEDQQMITEEFNKRIEEECQTQI